MPDEKPKRPPLPHEIIPPPSEVIPPPHVLAEKIVGDFFGWIKQSLPGPEPAKAPVERPKPIPQPPPMINSSPITGEVFGRALMIDTWSSDCIKLLGELQEKGIMPRVIRPDTPEGRAVSSHYGILSVPALVDNNQAIIGRAQILNHLGVPAALP